MRGKLSLKLEDLTVDSFHTVVTKKEKGTVFGEQCTCWTYCGQNTCPGCPTCGGDSCAGTCYNTCDDYSCAESCGGGCGAYSDMCNSYDPCPSAQYTNCGNVICY